MIYLRPQKYDFNIYWGEGGPTRGIDNSNTEHKWV